MILLKTLSLQANKPTNQVKCVLQYQELGHLNEWSDWMPRVQFLMGAVNSAFTITSLGLTQA